MAGNTTFLTRISGALLFLIGAVLLAGGGYLASLGGSFYYLAAGAAVLISGVLYWRGSRWGEHIYALMLAITLVWAVVESGANPWALAARLFAPAVLAIWLALPWVRRGLHDTGRSALWHSTAGLAAAVVLAVIVFRFVQHENTASVDAPPSPVAAAANPGTDTDWPHYANDLHGKHFAALSQINTQNVDRLEVAWVHNSGDSGKGEATPIKIGNTLYTCTPHGVVFALDPVTGKEKWRNDPRRDISQLTLATCRGVSFYRVPEGTGLCAERIIAGGPGGVLRAMDAASGKPCEDFGTRGEVDLLAGMGEVGPSDYTVNSAPTVVKDVIITGAFVNDNQNADIASGVVRAFDAKTGALRWAWDMGAPDRIGAPEEGETYTRGTANAWTAFAADEELGLVYVPTGNPSPDQYGVNRRPFDEKYGSAIVALNIADGRVRWSYQTTHHDLWDYDVPAQPTLITLPGPNGNRPALLQGTKRGDIFVLDRRTGAEIVPAPETPVPSGAMPGEALSKTQPISEINFLPPPLTEASMWGATPIDQMMCRIAFRQMRYEGPFTPPGLYRTLIYPGATGGIGWSGISVDDDNKIVIANTNDFPVFVQLVPRKDVSATEWVPFPALKTPYVVQIGLFMGPLGIPCLQPPWGQLAAVDLKTGKTMWRREIGTAKDSGPMGIGPGPPLLIGTPNLGGSLTTRGGLVFLSATLDRFIRAFDTSTGRILWQHRLPAGGQSTPMTYMAGGKQYVVMTAGGHALLGTRLGDATIAFRLPD
ncbi:MAG: membrane-bound PQQ-dependent dehydrogenase, glucose/quinate/shikimate family [Novosphingobium sp.]|nr:membrane-bound PQQ-dependent dehydrogenase, glucose/quinate/shikimate family [Novosphingobium sp.]MCP5404312.1 membrane-bound PQQ-dependent dehydrogenase, glucose/quinate/shikimate family [Novosphingobium sp.]